MQRGQSGGYEVGADDGEAVRAFVPDPLPPLPPLELHGGLQVMLERAVLALGRLDGVASLLPDKSLFLYTYERYLAVLDEGTGLSPGA